MSMLACHPAAAAQNIGRAVGFLQLRRIMQVSGVDGSPTAQIVRGYSINKNAPTGHSPFGVLAAAAQRPPLKFKRIQFRAAPVRNCRPLLLWLRHHNP